MRRPSCTLEKARKMSRFCGAAGVSKNRAPAAYCTAALPQPIFSYAHKFVDGTFSLLLRRNSDFSGWAAAEGGTVWAKIQKKCNLGKPQHYLLQGLKSTIFKIFFEYTGWPPAPPIRDMRGVKSYLIMQQPLVSTHNLLHYFSVFDPLCIQASAAARETPLSNQTAEVCVV